MRSTNNLNLVPKHTMTSLSKSPCLIIAIISGLFVFSNLKVNSVKSKEPSNISIYIIYFKEFKRITVQREKSIIISIVSKEKI